MRYGDSKCRLKFLSRGKKYLWFTCVATGHRHNVLEQRFFVDPVTLYESMTRVCTTE